MEGLKRWTDACTFADAWNLGWPRWWASLPCLFLICTTQTQRHSSDKTWFGSLWNYECLDLEDGEGENEIACMWSKTRSSGIIWQREAWCGKVLLRFHTSPAWKHHQKGLAYGACWNETWLSDGRPGVGALSLPRREGWGWGGGAREEGRRTESTAHSWNRDGAQPSTRSALCPEVTLECVCSCSQWLTVRNPSIKSGQKAVIFPLEDCPIV